MAVATVLAIAVGATGCTVAVPGAPAAPAAAASSADPTTAGQVPPRPRGELFRDAEGRFELNPPPGWGVDTTGKNGVVVIFVDTAENPATTKGSGATINVWVGPATGDWPGIIAQNRQALKMFQDYRSITDEAVTLVDGSAGHMFDYTFTFPNGEPKRNVQVMVVSGGSEYVVVTGQARPHEWDVYGEIFDTTLRSLVVAG